MKRISKKTKLRRDSFEYRTREGGKVFGYFFFCALHDTKNESLTLMDSCGTEEKKKEKCQEQSERYTVCDS